MIYIFLANGFEETEALTPADILRRAEIPTALVGVGNDVITGSHGISVLCDMNDSETVLDDNVDGIFLPGGMPGTINLEKSPAVQKAIDFAAEKGKLICAICAAPSILGHKSLLRDKNAVCFPGFEAELAGACNPDKFVCRDGNIITAKGMGSSVQFALEIVRYLKGDETADKIGSSLQIFEK